MSLSPAQIELRRTRIGSSEIGAIVDFYAKEGSPRCDPYKTAQKVFNEKVLPANDEPADHQVWGLDIEPGILAYHARKHGLQLVPPPGTLLHATFPICATPDGIGRRPLLVNRFRDIQAKNAQRFQSHRWGEPGTDDVPLLYVAQTTVELGILLEHVDWIGRIDDIADLAVCMEGAPPLAYSVKFDPEMFGQLATLAAKFKRDHLDTGKPPLIDGSDEAAEYVRRRFEKHSGLLKPWSDTAQDLVDRIRALAETEKAAATDKEEARTQLKNLIGKTEGIERIATWKKAKDTIERVTDWRASAMDMAAELSHHIGTEAAQARLEEVALANTTEEITRKGSRRLLLTKATGVAEIEPPKEEAA